MRINLIYYYTDFLGLTNYGTSFALNKQNEKKEHEKIFSDNNPSPVDTKQRNSPGTVMDPGGLHKLRSNQQYQSSKAESADRNRQNQPAAIANGNTSIVKYGL
jgi:hypothetical protein